MNKQYSQHTTCFDVAGLFFSPDHRSIVATQRSRAQVHIPTVPCVVSALLQYSIRTLTSSVLHREQWGTGTATVRMEHKVVRWRRVLRCQTVLLGVVGWRWWWQWWGADLVDRYR